MLSIELPPAIVAAINRQTEQFYQIQEYKFRVEREVEEAKRKQVEANGIAAFQKTVSKGISDSYLRWRGIEATLALAQSRNAKIVIIGSGKQGLPIILGNMDNNTNVAPGAVPAAHAPAAERPPAGTAPPLTPETAPPANTPPPGNLSRPSGASEMDGVNKTAAAAAVSAPRDTTQPANPPSGLAFEISEIKSLLGRISQSLKPNASPKPAGPAAPSAPGGAAGK